MAADLSTARHARVYALGAVLRNVISFIMLPIYTRHLSPADYGTIELLSMMVDVVGLIVGLRIEDAIFRYWHDTPNRDARLSVVSNALVVAVFANLVGVGFILVFAKPLTAFMFGSEENYPLTALFGLTLLFQALISVPLAYVRLQQRPWLYLSVSVARLILQLSLNIYFIVIRDMKSEGVIYSAVISSFVCGLAALVYLLRAVPFKIEQRQIVSMVRFSGPLILASVAAFYSTYGDRYFLRVYHGLADVGIYGLAYKFGFLLMSLVWEPFTKIWDIRRYQILKGEYVDETYNDNFVVMFGVMILAALGISVFLPDLLRIMAGPAYADAALVAPVILLACLVQAAMNFNSFPIYACGSTADIARGHWIGVLVITVGYLLLIPRFGMYGAAWATVGGVLANLGWVIRKGGRLLDMNLSWGRVTSLLAAATVLYLLSTLAEGDLLASVLAKGALVSVYGGIFWSGSTSRQRSIMRSYIRR